MIKTYFVTASWQKDQLSRAHRNEKVELDLKSTEAWEIVQDIHNKMFGRWESFKEDFTIDFMMEIKDDE